MKLHSYQTRIVEYLKYHRKAVLSVDMGLGKTAAVLFHVEQSKPKSLIIVAPKRVAETVWLQEAEKWQLTEIASKMVICSGTKPKRLAAINDTSRPYKIISRDNLRDIAGVSVDMLILDELTSFKNIESARSELVRSIVAPSKIGLTGTFIANGAIDTFGQFAAVGLVLATVKKNK